MIGVWLSGLVLVLLNLLTAYFAIIVWTVRPDAAYDRDRLAAAGAGAFLGMALALVTALLTIIPSKASWLSKWWYIVPATLFVVALARLVHLQVAYPD